MRLSAAVKKIHIYLGLLNFSALLVYGIAGLHATFSGNPEVSRAADVRPRFEEFVAPANASDKEVADLVYRQLAIPLSHPIPRWAIRRDAENRLALDFYTVNGIHRVRVLEPEKRLRIETQNYSVWRFFNNLHTFTAGGRPTDVRLKLWGWYNEFAMFALIAMAASGVWLWLSSRPRFRWAQLAFAGGTGLFVVLYAVTR